MNTPLASLSPLPTDTGDHRVTTRRTLDIGSIQLPITSVTKTFAILAKRGAGKSYTGAVMAEEFFKQGIPFVVFDPIDVWWGLRLSQDGRGKGIPVVVFGLEHADIPLERGMGRAIAQAVVAEQISCIISTFGMPKAAQRQLITEFSEELLNINDTPRHVFIEEAHEFVPQRVFGDLGRTFHAVSNLIVMGRNRGIGVTLINQRAATMNKDVLTQIDTLLAFRNVAPQDRRALREWVEYHAAEGDFGAFMESLPKLPTGEGWLWSPEFLEAFTRIKIRTRETFHPDREKLGDRFVVPQLEQIDVQRFIERFRANAAGQGTHQNGQAKKPKLVHPTPNGEGAVRRHQAELAEVKRRYEQALSEKDAEIEKLKAVIASIRDLVGGSEHRPAPSVSNGQGNSQRVTMWVEKLGSDTGAGRILDYLARKSGLKFTRSQIALAAGMSVNGGTFRVYIATLTRNNLIIQSDGLISINPELLDGE